MTGVTHPTRRYPTAPSLVLILLCQHHIDRPIDGLNFTLSNRRAAQRLGLILVAEAVERWFQRRDSHHGHEGRHVRGNIDSHWEHLTQLAP